MKKLQFTPVLICLISFLGGCSKKGMTELASLEQNFESSQTLENITVSCKRLTPREKAAVFGKKNLAFSPVLVTVENAGQFDVNLNMNDQAFTVLDSSACDIKQLRTKKIGRTIVSAVGIGAGAVSAGAGFFVSFFGWFQGIPLIMWGGLCGGVVGAVALPTIGILCGKKIAQAQKSALSKIEQAVLFNGSSAIIKKGDQKSFLLLFEKNIMPHLLPIKLEAQTTFKRPVLFELDMNSALQTNEFIQKTA